MLRSILIILLLVLSTSAEARSHGIVFTNLPQCASDTGTAGAPVATIQYPTLLNGYAVSSPCGVAGVSYAVGYPTATVLKDPSTLPTVAAGSGPLAGITKSGTSIRCDGGFSGSTLDGYDFSLANGWGLNIAACSNFTLTNSKFQTGSNCNIIATATGSPGFTISYSIIDGGGSTSGCATPATSLGEMLNLIGGGTVTIKYVWIKNVPQHFYTVSGSTNDVTFSVRYSLMERCGFYQGNHCNGGFVNGGNTPNIDIAFNTYISPQPDTSVTATGIVTTNGTNTITVGAAFIPSPSTNNSLHAGETISGTNIPGGTTIVSATTTGSVGATTTTIVMSQSATGSSGVGDMTVSNAYPSGTVFTANTFAQLTQTMNSPIVQGNTVIGPGPIITLANGMHCEAKAPAASNPVINAVYSGNYMDISNSSPAIQPFYPQSSGQCTNPTYGSPYPNINMTTGAAFTTSP